MHKSVEIKQNLITFLFLMITSFSYSQADLAPSITASGRQRFCPGNSIKIVTDFTISDPDDTTIASFFIQISTGYQLGFDILELMGNHPNITTSWNSNEGKLTLTSANFGTEILLTELENAVKDVVFNTNSNSITPEKFFSLSIGDANYLPSTDHFYEFVSKTGITWKDAKTAAENRSYYGRQGYLATLTSQIEADFAGEQASGAGWIGGSDEETEGVWKWVTGPEAGTVFWNGSGNGSSPAGEFANWHTAGNEPNDFGGNEDYAHITHPNLGVPGKWNDLPNISGVQPDNDYYPQGYIVEYGIPSDPTLNIVASTSIYIPQITSTTNASICEIGNATISAIASEGEIVWYENSNINSTSELARGTNFTVNNISTTTTFYASVSVNGCTTSPRIPVTITVLEKPTITNTTNDLICSGTATLNASASDGDVHWFESTTSTIPIFIGDNFTTPNLNATTSYYLEANNSGCISSARTEITAVVDNTIPEFDVLQTTYVLCADIGSIDLETTNPLGNYSYVWKKDGEHLSGNLSTININSSGIYTVSAISDAGCVSLEQTIFVKDSEKATITIDDVLISDDSNNNSIQIINLDLGSGEYEFAIDDEFGNYKSDGFFDNLSTGTHTLYINDISGCGTESFVFSVLAYPKFFTPNEDGINDFWKITGYDTTFYTSSEVLIYNRYGNLIYQFNENSQGWDGNYQGKKLPSNSYWFKVRLTDVNGLFIEKIGNFSLIRK
ncbi:T9SS type B sorting domain-containing protein [Polaribacter vadi]|uniref:Ig-like domain-containing protein n=1 Tax=Polaribacter TaxID=52959 RepID=UPI001C07FE8D|nr:MULTISPECIES: T9SS type B sorting domain-containing protein [Polaribacter]MBU3011238.1 T9SS type B sorting domain-containing protein [Polaribacter vadi]MDO6741051.1 T9SS type B sorting domain-containing protein [Polaribacter sp. 1_MG-2023]